MKDQPQSSPYQAGFADFKPALSELAVEVLSPVAAELRRLMDDPAYVDSVLASGAERAAAIADPVLDEVHEVVGLAAR